MANQPNVVWICTDQQFAGAMSCAGTDEVDTPAMDRLASAGTRFDRAYCTNPLCTPSRSSMLTGRMPSRVGVSHNGDAIDEEHREWELGRVFAAAGYDCAWAGKAHVPTPRHLEDDGGYDHGFTQLCGLDDRRLATVCERFLDGRSTDRPDSGSTPDEDATAPFFLAVHVDNPHNICEWARDYTPPWGSVESVSPADRPLLPANHAVPPYEPRVIRELVSGSRGKGAMEGATPDEWRAYRHAYYRLVERADRVVGAVLDALATRGLAEGALVVFTSDHGDGLGAHRLIQKEFLYEEMIRVPLIVSPPGAPIGEGDHSGTDSPSSETEDTNTNASAGVAASECGLVSDRLVSTGLDLLPTLCDYAGVDPPGDRRGRSLRQIVDGAGVDGWRDYVVAETMGGDAEERLDGRAIRTDRYKYVVYHEGRHNEQLFDLQDDPGEMVDLSESAAHADVRDAFRERLLEWCLETGDRFGARYHHPDVPMIPGYEFEDLWPLFTDDPPGFR